MAYVSVSWVNSGVVVFALSVAARVATVVDVVCCSSGVHVMWVVSETVLG